MNTRILKTCLVVGTAMAIILIVSISINKPVVTSPARAQHQEDSHGEEIHEEHSGAHQDERGDVHDDEHEGAHDGEHEEGVVRLDEHQLESLNLESAEVRRGSLSQTLQMPGEVQWNTDRLVHVSPRVPGIIVAVSKTLGDTVREGERLTLLDSTEIGRARIDYLSAISEYEVDAAELDRLEKVAANTRALLQILAKAPSTEEALEQAHDLRIGDYKTQLLGTYARLQVRRRTWEREQKLQEQQLTSEADYLEAVGDYETTRADYQALREAIDYEIDLELLRGRNAVRMSRTRMLNAERTLHVLGLTNNQTQLLREHATEIDEDVSRVGLQSSIDGLVVERHLSPGEQVNRDTILYKIADTANVWFMGRAYERDLRFLHEDLRAVVRLDAYPGELFEGRVDYLGSEVDPDSRTVPIRVVLPNPDNRLRAGLFGQVNVFTERGANEGLLVPATAVQRTAEGHAVFRVAGHGEFERVPVNVIEQNDSLVQVTGELEAGDVLATGDTFVLKTESERDALGGGHSH